LLRAQLRGGGGSSAKKSAAQRSAAILLPRLTLTPVCRRCSGLTLGARAYRLRSANS
jgi:hypothetical protein